MPVRRHLLTAGLPRATAPWRPFGGYERCAHLPSRLPVPWINAPCIKNHRDWHSFRDDALAAAHARCCVVCGLVVDGPIYLAAMSGGRQTSGMGGHAACILLSATRCPHLIDAQGASADGVTIAWRYDGDGPGCKLPALDDPDPEWGGGEEIDPSAIALTIDELRSEVRQQIAVARSVVLEA